MTRFLRICAGIVCPLVMGVLMVLLLERHMAFAAGTNNQTYVVNIITDGVDANTGDGVCDTDLIASGLQCTLRAAIQQANAHAGRDTVVLSGNLTYTLSITGVTEDDAAMGDLDIVDDLNLVVSPTLTGTHPLAVVDAQQMDRVFHVLQVQTEISGVVVYNGRTADAGGGILSDGILIMVNSQVFSNSAGDGGGILSYGTVIMTDSKVLSNSAGSGGGLYNYLGQLLLKDTVIQANTARYLGGGLLNNPDSTLEMNGGAILSNSIVSAEAFGAGLANANVAGLYEVLVQGNWISSTAIAIGAGLVNYNGGTLSLERSRMEGNWIQGTITNSGNGGGLHNAINSHTIMVSSTVMQNRAFVGGGIQNDGLMTITASSVYSNQAFQVGGGIANIGGPDPLAHLVVVNSTVSGNSSAGDAGGIRNDGDLMLHHVTVVRNAADTDGDGNGDGGGISTSRRANISMVSATYESVIGLNIDASPVVTNRIPVPDCSGTLVVQNYGLLQHTQGCQLSGTLSGAMIGVDPILGPLQDNGGDSWSVQPMFGSPLIDGGALQSCSGIANAPLSIDQRGQPRPLGDRCDLGAVEAVNLVTSKLYLPILQQ